MARARVHARLGCLKSGLTSGADIEKNLISQKLARPASWQQMLGGYFGRPRDAVSLVDPLRLDRTERPVPAVDERDRRGGRGDPDIQNMVHRTGMQDSTHDNDLLSDGPDPTHPIGPVADSGHVSLEGIHGTVAVPAHHEAVLAPVAGVSLARRCW